MNTYKANAPCPRCGKTHGFYCHAARCPLIDASFTFVCPETGKQTSFTPLVAWASDMPTDKEIEVKQV